MTKQADSSIFSNPISPLSKILYNQIPATPDSEIHGLVLFALIPVVVAFSFVVFVFYRSRRESIIRERETELRLQKSEVELKALKAQINPHFIFNCLNSIHHYMYTHPAEEAGNYLVKFSQQIRYVLESSEQKSVPLADEIEANRVYLELEQLRLNHSFGFAISCADSLDPDAVYIPPMLIQPFLENSVWHGVAGGGHILITFSPWDDSHLVCLIQDEILKASQRTAHDLTKQVKKTSMGMHLMQERFDMLNQLHGSNSGFTIIDRTDGILGKQVQILIPFED